MVKGHSCESVIRDQIYHRRFDEKIWSEIVWSEFQWSFWSKTLWLEIIFCSVFFLRLADKRLFRWNFFLLLFDHWQFTSDPGWSEIILTRYYKIESFFEMELFDNRFSHKFVLGWCDQRWFWCWNVCSKMIFVGKMLTETLCSGNLGTEIILVSDDVIRGQFILTLVDQSVLT